MTEEGLTEYERGVVDTLEILLRETQPSSPLQEARAMTLPSEIELAALDSTDIEDRLVHAARERHRKRTREDN